MAETTDRYALPLLQVGQAQKEVTHNEAVAAVDTLLHLAVETARLASPPAAPTVGQAWIVATGASGEWAGRAAMIANFGSAGWRYAAPRQGCVAWLGDVQRFTVFTAGGWRDDGWPVAALRIGARTLLGAAATTVPVVSGGAVVDLELRAAVAALVAGLRDQGLVAA